MEDLGFLTGVVMFVALAGLAWEHLANTVPGWLRTVTGFALALWALSVLVALL